jgi:hypothetical protein
MKYACAAATLTVVIRPELFQRRIIGGEIGDIVGAEPFKNSLFIVVSDSVVKLALIAAEQRHLSPHHLGTQDSSWRDRSNTTCRSSFLRLYWLVGMKSP